MEIGGGGEEEEGEEEEEEEELEAVGGAEFGIKTVCTTATTTARTRVCRRCELVVPPGGRTFVWRRKALRLLNFDPRATLGDEELLSAT